MNYTALLDLPLYLGLFLLGLTGAVVFALVFGGRISREQVLSKELYLILLGDMKNPKIVLGGPLGLIRHMLRLALVLIAVGLVIEGLAFVFRHF